MTHHLVTEFLSGYFHEDWHADAETDADIVAVFLRSKGSAFPIASLAADLEVVAKERISEQSNEWLLNEYGCYYDPSADGLSGANWLLRLASMLDRDAASAENSESDGHDKQEQ